MIVETEFDILSRLLQIEGDHLSPEGARFVLSIHFTPAEHERMKVLGIKANEAHLTEDERTEYERYIRVSDLLSIMKSKARILLKQAGQSL